MCIYRQFLTKSGGPFCITITNKVLELCLASQNGPRATSCTTDVSYSPSFVKFALRNVRRDSNMNPPIVVTEFDTHHYIPSPTVSY